MAQKRIRVWRCSCQENSSVVRDEVTQRQHKNRTKERGGGMSNIEGLGG